MAEIEHYVDPDNKDHPKFDQVKHIELNFLPADVQLSGKTNCIKMSIGEAVSSKMVNNQTLGYFLARVALFLQKIGIVPEYLRFRQHMKTEMAHYATDCWDAEIFSSYGWVECVGNADRACYDLSVHSKRTKEKLVVREKLPNPIQKSIVKLKIDKKVAGIKFKNESKVLVSYLEGLEECDLLELKCKMESGNGAVEISANGIQFSLDSSIVSIENVTETLHVREYIPSVIEPSFGIGRIIYSLLEHSFWARQEDENRTVLSLPPLVAPVKCLIIPLSHNSEFKPFLQEFGRIS
jgi:glycyl-tRNA synthetase